MECLICYKKVYDSIPAEVAIEVECQDFSTLICKLFSIPASTTISITGLFNSSIVICPDCIGKCWKIQEIFVELDQIRSEIQAGLYASQRLCHQNGHYCPERDAIIQEIKKVNGDDANLDLDVKIPLGFIDEASTGTGSPPVLNLDDYSFPAQSEDHFKNEDRQDLNAFIGVTTIGKEIRIILEPLPFIDESAGQININIEPWTSFIKRNHTHKTITVKKNKIERKRLKLKSRRSKPTNVDPDFKTKRIYKKRSQVHITTCPECNITFNTRRELLDHNLKSHSTIFYCDHCPKRYINKTNYTEHLRTHGIGDTLFKCDDCDKLFPRNHQLKEHKLIVHDKVEPFICHICSRGFKCRASLKYHISSNHNNDPKTHARIFYCDECPKSYRSKINYTEHLRTHGIGDTLFKCDDCDKLFSRNHQLKEHKLIVHEKVEPFICHICSKGFKCRTSLKNHISSIHNNDPKSHDTIFYCDECPKSYRSKINFTEHLRTHGIGDALFKCDIDDCDKLFPRKHQLKEHKLIVHEKVEPFLCHLCSKGFKSRLTRRLHISSIHNNEQKSQPKVLYCHKCIKSYRNEANFTEHLRTHGIGDTLFKCDIDNCDNFFSRNHQLQEHKLIIHEKIKPLLCHLCSKGFTKNAALKHHISSFHENDQKFKCTESNCEKTFTTDYLMKKHVQNVHKKERIYLCPIESCKKGFVTIFNQKQHYNFVHLHFKKPKKFKCSECEKLFFSNANLRNHIAQWHSTSFDFPCPKPKCNKIFATHRKLNNHLLVVHLEGEARHPCTHPNCPKKFYEKLDLKKHYLINHADESEKPLICTLCSKRFVNNYKLKRHQMQVHKIGINE